LDEGVMLAVLKYLLSWTEIYHAEFMRFG